MLLGNEPTMIWAMIWAGKDVQRRVHLMSFTLYSFSNRVEFRYMLRSQCSDRKGAAMLKLVDGPIRLLTMATSAVTLPDKQ